MLLCICITLGQTAIAQEQTPYQDVAPFINEARKLRNQNKIDLALETLDKAAAEAEKNEDVKALIDSYHELAILYLKLDREGDTQFYWDRASVLLKDIAYPYGDAIHKHIEAILLYRDNQNFQALSMLEKAKQLNNDRNFFNNILLTEAKVYINLERYDNAIKNLNSLVVNTDIYEKDYLSTQAYLGLADLYLQNGDLKESAKNGELALKLSLNNEFFVETKKANELLTAIYEQLGLYENAYTKSQNLLYINDSIFNLEKLKVEAKTADQIRDDIKTKQIVGLETKVEELTASQNRS
jgi:tetratricopeptide (TPR) repeat protein